MRFKAAEEPARVRQDCDPSIATFVIFPAERLGLQSESALSPKLTRTDATSVAIGRQIGKLMLPTNT